MSSSWLCSISSQHFRAHQLCVCEYLEIGRISKFACHCCGFQGLYVLFFCCWKHGVCMMVATSCYWMCLWQHSWLRSGVWIEQKARWCVLLFWLVPFPLVWEPAIRKAHVLGSDLLFLFVLTSPTYQPPAPVAVKRNGWYFRGELLFPFLASFFSFSFLISTCELLQAALLSRNVALIAKFWPSLRLRGSTHHFDSIFPKGKA